MEKHRHSGKTGTLVSPSLSSIQTVNRKGERPCRAEEVEQHTQTGRCRVAETAAGCRNYDEAERGDERMDRIPGADTLGVGFNITKRYHESSTTSQVFKEGKADYQQMTIGTTPYAVPQNIAAEIAAMTDLTTHVYTTRQQVQNHFSSKAGISGSGFGFKGQFDASYSHVATSEKSYYYALVEASNHAYNLKLKEQSSKWFTSSFADDIGELPTAHSQGEAEDIFFAFFGKYGTTMCIR